MTGAIEMFLPARDYDLEATLDSGQVFRWEKQKDFWTGIVGKNRVRLTQTGEGIHAQTGEPVMDWQWLRDFLQTETDLATVLKTFPDDEPMRRAVAACRGLRLLRQEPWECLASFILSSTKQIVQIRQIISLLCEKFGEPLTQSPLPFDEERIPRKMSRIEPLNLGRDTLPRVQADPQVGPTGSMGRAGGRGNWVRSFPSPEKIAGLAESDLRACKMGFRAPHLLNAARQIAGGKLDLERIRGLTHIIHPLVRAAILPKPVIVVTPES